MITQTDTDALLGLLQRFDEEGVLTADELVAVRVLRDAALAIARGETLEPPAPGEPLKLRLLQRISVQYFHHLAPRPKTAESLPVPP